MANVTHSALSGSNLHAPNFAVVAPGSTLGTYDAGAGYQLSFANGSGVTFGLSNSTLTASVAAIPAAGTVSAGTASVALQANSLVFANGSGVSFGLNGSTVTASVAAIPAAGTVSAGTASVALQANSIVLSNSNGVSFGLNGSTVTASVTHLTGDYWDNLLGGSTPAAANGTFQFGGGTRHGTLGIAPLAIDPAPFPYDMTIGTMMLNVSISGSTATMSSVFSSSFSFGIYTSTGGTLSLLNSCSFTFGTNAAATNNSTGFADQRFMTIHSSQWSTTPVLAQGQKYFLGTIWGSGGQTNQSNTLIGAYMAASAQRSGTLGISQNPSQTQGSAPFYGLYSASTTSMPASIVIGDLNKTGAVAAFVPHLIMVNHTGASVF